MNNKTNTWAVIIKNPQHSEAVQRIAFSFGYKWGVYGEDLVYKDAKMLFFSPNSKIITYGLTEKIHNMEYSKVCNTIEQVVETFMNPPENQQRIVENVVIYKDGSVDLVGEVLTSSKFDKLIKVRDEFLGRKSDRKSRLPKIGFVYGSPISGNRDRQVMVVDDLGDTYACLDMGDGNSFKQFRKDRIVGKITFLGLSEEKEW